MKTPPVKRWVGQSKKSLPLIIAIVVVSSWFVLFLRPQELDDSTSVVKGHLDEFLGSSSTIDRNSANSSTTVASNNDINLEKYPIVVIPYNGSVDPFYNVPSDGTNLWDDDPRIPEWAKAYFNWHKKRRQTWDPNHWADDRWMIMQCLANQDTRVCGGTADRLKPLPTLLRIAYEHHRMLLIRWTRPATLETFLVPPTGGVDWRVPDWLADVLSDETNGRRFVPSKVIRKYAPTNLTLLRTRYQSQAAGRDIYNASRRDGEPTFEEVFAPLWRLFFRPSPAVAKIIQDQMESHGLVPGQYVAAHLRALYAIDSRPLRTLRHWTVNAVNCASQLRPGAPIFFASDSSDAIAIAQTYAAEQKARVVIHTPSPNPPLHIDQDPNWKERAPSEYFDTFVDLYLISFAGCVAFNIGGYGQWGLLIGGNVTCKISHRVKQTGAFINKCSWHSGGLNKVAPPAVAAATGGTASDAPPLFLEPMP